MTVTSKEQAWKEAIILFSTEYEKDEEASQKAGYDIYRHVTKRYNRICDLGDRLELLTGEYGENVTNIWIKEETRRKNRSTEEILCKQLELLAENSREATGEELCKLTFAMVKVVDTLTYPYYLRKHVEAYRQC